MTVQQSHLTRSSIFAANRRADVSVEMNEPIFETLGKDAQPIADYLTKAGAALLEPYPDACISFSLSRLLSETNEAIRQDVRIEQPHIGPTFEKNLRNVMTSASTWLQTYDPLAFVFASVTCKPTMEVTPMRQKRDRLRWWRSDD